MTPKETLGILFSAIAVLLLVESFSVLEWTCMECRHKHKSGAISSLWRNFLHTVSCEWGRDDDV